MASTWPPVKNTPHSFPISLVSQASTHIFQTNVTITTADAWVSKDSGAFVAVTAAPVELLTDGGAKTGVLWQGLTATEMTADVVTVLYHDAAGDEWQDVSYTVLTAAQTLDTVDANVDSILTDTGTDGVLLTSAYDAAKSAAPTGAAMTLTSAYDAAKTAAATGAAMTLATGAVTAAAVAAGAIDADAISVDAGTEIGTAVWISATRTLTQSAAGVTATVAGSAITATRGDTLSASFSNLGSITGRTNLWFAAKQFDSDTDAEALIFIEETDGMTYFDGAAHTPVADGSISVTSASAGNLTVTVAASCMAALGLVSGNYDVQYRSSASAVTTLTAGKFTVVPDQARATS